MNLATDVHQQQPLLPPPPPILRLVAPVLLDKKPSGIILSPSQIDRWDTCQRWWAWQYIAKIRTPPHPSAQLGTDVHAHLEKWLRDATPPPTQTANGKPHKSGVIATRMITTLVKHGVTPGRGVVERHFWFRTQHGHQYTGYIDWSGVLDDMVATVIDHKTSGNLDWAKTEAGLHNDIQAVIYAVVGFIGFQTDTLRMFWNYGETKKKYNTYAIRPVTTVVHLSVIAEKFERVIEPAAAEIINAHHGQQHPLSFPPSPQSCGNYGGCPHQHRCNLTDQEKLGGIMSDPNAQPTMAQKMASQVSGGQQPQLPGIQPNPGQPLVAQPAGAMPMAPPAGAAPPQAFDQAGQQIQGPHVAPAPPPGVPPGFAAPPGAATSGMLPPGGPPVAAQPPPGAPLGPQQPPQGGAPGTALAVAPQTSVVPAGAPGAPQDPNAIVGAPGAVAPGPYAPNVAPNPPETGITPPADPAEAAGADPGKRTRGRPAGSPNRSKTLTLEAQVYMGGVYACIGHPLFNPGTQESAQLIANAGEMALTAYKAKF